MNLNLKQIYPRSPLHPPPPRLNDGLPFELHRLRPFKHIGSGSFGKVFQVTDPSDKKGYALKCVSITAENKESVRKEVEILMKLQHPNIVQIYGAWPKQIDDGHAYMFFTNKSINKVICSQDLSDCDCIISDGSTPPECSERQLLFIKMELCEIRTIEDFITLKSNNGKIKNFYTRLSVEKVRNYFGQLLAAMDYIRKIGIIHKDIKPNNILIQGELIKLADFGLSELLQPELQELETQNPTVVLAIKENSENSQHSAKMKIISGQKMGQNILQNESNNKYLVKSNTNPYKSPELVANDKTSPVTHKTDIYSVGCVLFSLLSDNRQDINNFSIENEKNLAFNRLRELYPENLDLVYVAERMVATNPSDRPDTTDEGLRLMMHLDAQLMQSEDPINTDSSDSPLKIIPRSEWNSRPPIEITEMNLPVPMVIICHSVYGEGHCATDKCCRIVMKEIQNLHMEVNKWSDVAYQFAVGGNGYVYEGRGWDRVGAHSYQYNNRSIGICLLGDFSVHLPPRIQIETTKKLIAFGVEQGFISRDYKLYGHRDVRPHLESPGDFLFRDMCSWANKAPPPIILSNYNALV